MILAFGIREKCNKCVEASTMAMLKPIPRVAACFSAARVAMRAPVRVSWGVNVVVVEVEVGEGDIVK